MSQTIPPHVALFVTCLVELYRPSVARASQMLLERAGCRVSMPRAQTCCGQPGYNSGDRAGARAMAQHIIEVFEPFDHVVAPSGSCAAMLVRHYPKLFSDTDPWHERAAALGRKTHELTAFLAETMRLDLAGVSCPNRIAYHDGCSGLRELGVKSAPRTLLAQVDGAVLSDAAEPERCCGFGGLFSVKYDRISEAIGSRKLDSADAGGAALLVAGELGCLLHLAGLAKRQGRALRCRHVAEILAGLTDRPAIGETS